MSLIYLTFAEMVFCVNNLCASKQSNQLILNIYLLSSLIVHNLFCCPQHMYTILTVFLLNECKLNNRIPGFFKGYYEIFERQVIC